MEGGGIRLPGLRETDGDRDKGTEAGVWVRQVELQLRAVDNDLASRNWTRDQVSLGPGIGRQSIREWRQAREVVEGHDEVGEVGGGVVGGEGAVEVGGFGDGGECALPVSGLALEGGEVVEGGGALSVSLG
jgi:hypothetical protein